ncbi:LSU ribosomal protein L9P [Balneicella halophila]|uniref:Large ribosomal subunit protein bL9 n=1 Tax=Balneicella halophila TaxID=1537566 RepID=A0A7L4URK1_BALHA|nr:50S ribosomal protein L9 [Balneicella halophila]PVX52289.1 LSU ribosomal protein L9P [Balneicella halophila]
MEVILKKDMPGLGDRNDIVTIKPGYGHNYLIPQGIAVVATPSAIKAHEETMKQQAKKEVKIRDEAQELANKLKGLELKVKVKTSDKGKLFGTVNNATIADAIKEHGVELDRRRITLKDPVKTVGTYEAVVKLHKEVSTDISFEVVGQETKEEKK